MTIGTIIGARISGVLEIVLRFSCGIAVIGVATQVVSHVALSYRQITSSRRKDVKKTIENFERKRGQHADIETSLMVQWHVEMLSALVMMGIFVVACRLAVGGDYTADLIQSLSVGIGFGLRDIVNDALCGTLVMMQGYGKVGTVVNIDTDKSTAEPLKHRICQVHLTHVVLIEENDAQKTDNAKVVYIVKTWSSFYNKLRYTMPVKNFE